jgi:hypothetical protein
MSLVHPTLGKHLCRTTIDDVGNYYSKKCRVLPLVHSYYFECLTYLEAQGKICLLPNAILERFHMNFNKRLQVKARKTAQK